MKIKELLAQDTLSLSIEVFPPKTESGFDSVKHATEEIAALLEVPSATVRTRLHRARRQLKDLLGGIGDE